MVKIVYTIPFLAKGTSRDVLMCLGVTSSCLPRSLYWGKVLVTLKMVLFTTHRCNLATGDNLQHIVTSLRLESKSAEHFLLAE